VLDAADLGIQAPRPGISTLQDDSSMVLAASRCRQQSGEGRNQHQQEKVEVPILKEILTTTTTTTTTTTAAAAAAAATFLCLAVMQADDDS
jgi:hypothetical protein